MFLFIYYIRYIYFVERRNFCIYDSNINFYIYGMEGGVCVKECGFRCVYFVCV